jgi:hypothetical protein
MSGFTDDVVASMDPKDEGRRGFLTAQQEKCRELFLSSCDKEALDMAKYTMEHPSDCALRFLRARKFAVDKALELLNEAKAMMIKERAKEFGKMTPDDAGEADIDLMKTFYPHTVVGHSKENTPIVWEHEGRIDIQAIITMMTRENLLGYHFWNMETNLDEHFTRCSKLPAVKTASQTTDTEDSSQYSANPIATMAILDLTGFGLAQMGQKTMDQIKLYISTDNVCYPETLGKMLIINAPYILSSAWGIIKGWLDPRTVGKIEIISSTEASLKRLHELINKDQLRAEYGGTAPDLYHQKKNCGFQWIGRGGEFAYEITVPSGCGLTIDTYVGEGPVEYTVQARTFPTEEELEVETLKKTIAAKSNANSSGWFSKKEDATSPAGPVTFEKLAYLPTKTHASKVAITPTNNKRERHLQHLSKDDLAGNGRSVQVQVVWKNPSRMSQRPLVFALTLTQ